MSNVYCGIGRPKATQKTKGTDIQCLKIKMDKIYTEHVKKRGRLRGRLSKLEDDLKEFKRLDDDAPVRLKKYTEDIKKIKEEIPKVKSELKEATTEFNKFLKSYECFNKSLKDKSDNKKCNCK